MNYGEHYVKMDSFESQNAGFYFCGNFKKGISVGDCVKNASELCLLTLNPEY
jgi:hypothetical protein